MSIIIRKVIPEYEIRKEIECVTMYISVISRGSDTALTARLDKGLATEREVTWVHAKDHPVFVMPGRSPGVSG